MKDILQSILNQPVGFRMDMRLSIHFFQQKGCSMAKYVNDDWNGATRSSPTFVVDS
jgi:hypothetical protein